MALKIDVSGMGQASAPQATSGGKGGKEGVYGTIRDTVCELLESLDKAESTWADGTPTTALSRYTRDEWQKFVKTAWPNGNGPDQELRTYYGHYQRVEHGYGPAAAYTGKDRREHSAGWRKHIRSLKSRLSAYVVPNDK